MHHRPLPSSTANGESKEKRSFSGSMPPFASHRIPAGAESPEVGRGLSPPTRCRDQFSLSSALICPDDDLSHRPADRVSGAASSGAGDTADDAGGTGRSRLHRSLVRSVRHSEGAAALPDSSGNHEPATGRARVEHWYRPRESDTPDAVDFRNRLTFPFCGTGDSSGGAPPWGAHARSARGSLV